MTGKFSLKAVCAALALAAAGSANAGLFFMDVGTNYGGVTAGKVNATSTAVKNQMTFQYVSSTIFKDQDSNLGISVGDTTTTTAGLAIPGALVDNNQITAFTPNQNNFSNTNSNNGYQSNWLLSFGIENLTGTVTSTSLLGPEIAYNSGAVIKMYIWDTNSGAAGLNFMNIKVSGGSSGTGGTFLDGEVDFTGIADNAFKNLFNTAAPNSCGGYTGFYDLWANCSGDPAFLKISFNGDFNTDGRDLNTTLIGFEGGKALIQASNIKHDGSATFDIPEPGTLALAGLALVGLASARRRKA